MQSHICPIYAFRWVLRRFNTEPYAETCQAFKIHRFVTKIVNCGNPITMFAKKLLQALIGFWICFCNTLPNLSQYQLVTIFFEKEHCGERNRFTLKIYWMSWVHFRLTTVAISLQFGITSTRHFAKLLLPQWVFRGNTVARRGSSWK